jgi:hypothetical protein
MDLLKQHQVILFPSSHTRNADYRGHSLIMDDPVSYPACDAFLPRDFAAHGDRKDQDENQRESSRKTWPAVSPILDA